MGLLSLTVVGLLAWVVFSVGERSWLDIAVLSVLAAVAVGAFAALRAVTRSLSASVGSRAELQIRLGQQEAVTRLSQLALTDVSRQELLDEACAVVAAELQTELAGVLELLADRSTFLVRAGVGWPPELVGVQCVPAGPHSQGGFTMASSRPVIMGDAEREDRFELSAQMVAQGIVSGLTSTIGSNGGAYGVLGAHSYGRREFSDHDATFLEAVASVLASALRRRRAEEEADQTHRVLEAVIEGTTDDVFVKDLSGRFIALNARAAGTIGLPREELIGRTLHELLPDRVADAMVATDLLILERGSAETFEETVTIGDAAHVFLTTKGPYRSQDGTLLGTFGIARDITARRAQEQELAQSEESLRLAQEGARMGTWDVDLLTGFTTWSEGLRTLFGVGPNYPAGFEHFAPLLHADDREQVTQGVTDAYNRGIDFELECRIVQPDGELRWLLARSSSLRSDDGTLARVLGVAADITERKVMEQELRSANDYADRLIETSNAIVLVLDSDANIVTFNRAAEEITGYTRDEVEGRSWDMMLPRDLYQAPWDEHARLVATGEPRKYENPILTKAGEERVILWQNSQLHGQDDAVVGTVSFGIDVTEQKRARSERTLLENRLRQAEKLEALGQLAGGVAHDFNNLLVAIHGYGELALARLERGEEGVADDVQEVLKAADRAAGLTKQLLAFGRRQVLNPEVLDLNDVVRKTDALLQRLIGDNVELVTRLAEQPVLVKADRGQLEQVITNLVVNGRDAMPGGGVVTIGVATGDLDSGGDDGSRHALLSVTDEGTGIDAVTTSHIFEPFFTTKGDRGTGLGLATVHGIVSQSGGQLVLDTEPGRGSTFGVYLPLCAARPTSSQTLAATASCGGTETILLVEDDPTVRSLVSKLLAARGYAILGVADGEEAIERFGATKRPIHLIISDLMMPGLDGRETVERIRSIEPATKALYMSGYTNDAIIQNGAELQPGTSFIQKPFSGDQLASSVRGLLDGLAV
jgi:PAS domain S-box-containing protein